MNPTLNALYTIGVVGILGGGVLTAAAAFVISRQAQQGLFADPELLNEAAVLASVGVSLFWIGVLSLLLALASKAVVAGLTRGTEQ